MVSISSVKEYASKLPQNEKSKIIEAILPNEIVSAKKLRSELCIGRKKLKTASVNRKNIISDTPRKRHASSGKSKLTFDQASKIFNFFYINSTPITGSNAEAKILSAPFRETSSQKNSYLFRLYDELGVEVENLLNRGTTKEYLVYNSHVVKDKYDDLHRSFCQSEFEVSWTLFMDFKPFFIIPYSNQWDSMCHCHDFIITRSKYFSFFLFLDIFIEICKATRAAILSRAFCISIIWVKQLIVNL